MEDPRLLMGKSSPVQGGAAFKILYKISWILFPILILATQYHWVKKTGFAYCGSNMAEHLLRAQGTVLAELGLNEPQVEGLDKDFRGVLLEKTSGLLARVFGPSFPLFIMANCFYLLVLFFSLGMLGWTLDSEATGLTAAVLGTSIPMVFAHGRLYNLDLSVAALSLLTLAAFIHSDSFAKIRWAALVGMALGLAMLVKITAPGYLAPAMLVGFLVGLRREGRWELSRLKRQLTGLALTLFVAALIAAPWYAPRLSALWKVWIWHMVRPDAPSFHDELGTPAWILVPCVLGPVLTLLIPLSLPHLVRKRVDHLAVLAVFSFAPLVFFSIKPMGIERFLIAPMGGLAVLAALSLTRGRGAKAAGVIFCIVTALSLTALHQSPHMNRLLMRRNIFLPLECYRMEPYGETLSAIRSLLRDENEPTVIYISQYPAAYFQADFWKFLVRDAVPSSRVWAIDPIHHFYMEHYREVARRIDDATLVLYHSPPGGPSWPTEEIFDTRRTMRHDAWQEARLKKRRPLFRRAILPAQKGFDLVRSIPLRSRINEGTLYIHKRISD